MGKATAGKLLLIDDEPALLQLMQTYLTRLGYEVEAIGDGQRAWARYRENAGAYQLVVADLNMPGVDIYSLLPRLPDYNPDIRVLVCSGEVFEVGGLPHSVQEHFDFLQKPFVPKMLADAVAGCLRRRQPVTA